MMDTEHDEMWMLLLYLNFLGAAYWCIHKRRTKRRPRRYAVRPLNRSRRKQGHFANLVQFMKKYDPEQFFKYTRLTPDLFDHLLDLVGPHLQKRKTRITLEPSQRLVMTLHFLSAGCSMQEIAWNYYVGKTTVHKVVKETCTVLWNILSPIYLPPLKETELEKVEEGFYKRWNLPNCIGALDGKHVSIQAPPHSGTSFFSYKKCFSLVLMATCDAYYRFTYVDIGGEGSQHDSLTFRNSGFGEALMQEKLPLPEAKPLPGENGVFPYFFVADQAFPLHKHIMRPYPGDNLPAKKRIYNYRISRARRCIENTFGILAQRWRCLRKPIIGNDDTCIQIVQACVVLHNYVQKREEDIPLAARRYCPTGFADYVDEDGNFHYGEWRQEGLGLQSVGRLGSNNHGKTAKALREELATYFTSEQGEVQWQYDLLEEGAVPPDFAQDFTL